MIDLDMKISGPMKWVSSRLLSSFVRAISVQTRIVKRKLRSPITYRSGFILFLLIFTLWLMKLVFGQSRTQSVIEVKSAIKILIKAAIQIRSSGSRRLSNYLTRMTISSFGYIPELVKPLKKYYQDFFDVIDAKPKTEGGRIHRFRLAKKLIDDPKLDDSDFLAVAAKFRLLMICKKWKSAIAYGEQHDLTLINYKGIEYNYHMGMAYLRSRDLNKAIESADKLKLQGPNSKEIILRNEIEKRFRKRSLRENEGKLVSSLLSFNYDEFVEASLIRANSLRFGDSADFGSIFSSDVFKSIFFGMKSDNNKAYLTGKCQKVSRKDVIPVFCSGFGWSGSGAVAAFLKQFEGFYSLPGGEINLIEHRNFGLNAARKIETQQSNEYCLDRKFIHGYLLCSVLGLTNISMLGQAYSQVQRKSFVNIAKRLGADPVEVARIVEMFLLTVADSSVLGRYSVNSLQKGIFILLDFLLDRYRPGSYVVFNNVTHAYNLHLISPWGREFRFIAVTRDPRDQFYEKYNLGREKSGEDFCSNLRSRLDSYLNSINDTMYRPATVHFSDFVADSSIRSKIYKYVTNVEVDQSRKKRNSFSVMESSRNIGIYKDFHDGLIIDYIEKFFLENKFDDINLIETK